MALSKRNAAKLLARRRSDLASVSNVWYTSAGRETVIRRTSSGICQNLCILHILRLHSTPTSASKSFCAFFHSLHKMCNSTTLVSITNKHTFHNRQIPRSQGATRCAGSILETLLTKFHCLHCHRTSNCTCITHRCTYVSHTSAAALPTSSSNRPATCNFDLIQEFQIL